MDNHIELEPFLNLPVEEVAELVRISGLKVCVFPFNGTRRWFFLEHGHEKHPNMLRAYNDLTGKRYIDMYRMLFDHGIETVIAPVFGGDIMDRGQEYMHAIGAAMTNLADHPDFRSFYSEKDVRVHFYGNYRKIFADGPYAFITESFDKSTADTSTHQTHRLFYGVFGNDATEATAEIAIQFFQQHSRTPTRKEIIERYYGEPIEKANIFIGFEKFNAFDYPLLNWGDESLYFTAAPSLFMSETQLRHILYDHLYLRTIGEPEYQSMSKPQFEAMRKYYEDHRETTYGIGEIHDGIWYLKH